MRLTTISTVQACLTCVLLLAAQGSAATPTESPLAELSFLVGGWQAAGTGDPGRSVGEFSFEWAADRHALVRHNEAVTSTGRHKDIMLVYAQPDGTVHAIYADNEGHTIDYDVTIDSTQHRVVFESPGAGPRFRLWYQLHPDGTMSTGFEIAQPGSTEFQTYLEGSARHK